MCDEEEEKTCGGDFYTYRFFGLQCNNCGSEILLVSIDLENFLEITVECAYCGNILGDIPLYTSLEEVEEAQEEYKAL